MNWLVAPLEFTFMQTGLLAALLVGITCAVLGVYVVLRRMAFIGDALAHTALPGVVVALPTSWPTTLLTRSCFGSPRCGRARTRMPHR